jgi:hypothetical protein
MLTTRLLTVAILCLAVCGAAAAADDAEGFKPLFDGETLDGWTQRGGKATYEVLDGVIVGTSQPNTPNSFLCTEADYGDFVLEYEFQVDPQLNSGVQIRSQAFDEPKSVTAGDRTLNIAAGRVHGYQVEIDPNQPKRMWAGGIYDEGRRGWLYPGPKGGEPKEFTKQGQRLYKTDGWNKVRVECEGPRIRTYLNGEPRADFEDDLSPRGFIALQVHGVGGREEPLRARWRNIRIKTLD